MSDKEFYEMVLSMIRATEDMGEDEYTRIKLCLYAVCNWSEAVHNFVIIFFDIADRRRPLLLEMH